MSSLRRVFGVVLLLEIICGVSLGAMSGVPNAAASPPLQRPPLSEAQAAFDRGDAAAAIARAEAFIAASPGHPDLADAQLLLARSRERVGNWAAAREQYRLFASNYPRHAAARGALARAADLARRHASAPTRPVARWRIVSANEPAVRFERWGAGATGATGVILALGRRPDWDVVGRLIDDAAVSGVRLLLWQPLDEPDAPFDPFDEPRLKALEAAYRAAARLQVDGFFVGPALSLGAHPRSAAAQAVEASLSRGILPRSETSGRTAWAWAGLRARASARALGRFVQAAERVTPGRPWFATVSADSVVHPAAAILHRGEDLAELRRAAPRLVPVLIGLEAADREKIGRDLSRLGFSARAFEWAADGELVALP